MIRVLKQCQIFLQKNCSGVQHELFAQKSNDADSIDIVSVYDVFSDEEIKDIKKYVNPL